MIFTYKRSNQVPVLLAFATIVTVAHASKQWKQSSDPASDHMMLINIIKSAILIYGINGLDDRLKPWPDLQNKIPQMVIYGQSVFRNWANKIIKGDAKHCDCIAEAEMQRSTQSKFLLNCDCISSLCFTNSYKSPFYSGFTGGP